MFLTFLFLTFFPVVEDDPMATVLRINKHLPDDVRVQSIKRVTKNFNSKTACDAR